jgi:hypothetical protein
MGRYLFNEPPRPRFWHFGSAKRQKANHLRNEVEKAFTTHPAQTGETYWQHLHFTVIMTVRLLFSALVLLLHGILPFLCTRTASRQVEIIYRLMRQRIPKHRHMKIDAVFEV